MAPNKTKPEIDLHSLPPKPAATAGPDLIDVAKDLASVLEKALAQGN